MKRIKEKIQRLKHPRLRILVESLYDIQKLRIAAANRLTMYEKLDILTPTQAVKLQEIVLDMKTDEKELLLYLLQELKVIPIWQWLKIIKGIGPAMAGGVIAWIDDISKFPHVSSLWKYSGFHVEDGKAPRRKRGERAPWNARLHTHMWKVVKQMLQAGDPFYRGYYDRYKQYEIDKCEREGLRIVPSAKLPTKGGKKYEPEGVISTGHVDNRAKRKVAKLFLVHMWHVWRKMEGLPTTSPYAEKLGHRVISPPNWPLKVKKEKTSGTVAE